MNKLNKVTLYFLCAMILSSCALLNKGVALPSPTEEIRG